MKYRYILSFAILLSLIFKPTFWEDLYACIGWEPGAFGIWENENAASCSVADFVLEEGFSGVVSSDSISQNNTVIAEEANLVNPHLISQQNIRVLLTFDGRIYQDDFIIAFNEDMALYEKNGEEYLCLENIADDSRIEEDDLQEYFAASNGAPRYLYAGVREEDSWDYDNGFSLTLTNAEGITKQVSYEGICILGKDDNGIYIINELPLESYLYYVLPSEMPSSFPMEALKAQAICARTYAATHLENSSLRHYNAHVNDTTVYQVYNASGTTEAATQAVNETRGMVLRHEGELITAYYYSCSAGRSTTADIWPNYSASDLPYLVYREYGALEEECPWFSWVYSVNDIDEERLRSSILQRLEANENCVMVYENYDEEENALTEEDARDAILALDSVCGMEIIGRGTGDVVSALCIKGETYDYIIQGEYSIRYVLGQQNYELLLQNGEEANSGLVPSGFFSMECEYVSNELDSYVLTGGGFGHGVGMSQYGAKYLAEEGYSAQDILTYYYENVTIDTIEYTDE